MTTRGAGMVAFRIALVAAWFVMVPVTIHAVGAQGISGLGTFVSDFDNPWRAQINSDFSVHLCLAIAWIVYREPSLTRGVSFALPVLLGSLYLLPYIFAASFRCDVRFSTLLVGESRRASESSRC